MKVKVKGNRLYTIFLNSTFNVVKIITINYISFRVLNYITKYKPTKQSKTTTTTTTPQSIEA
jgi:hypothetical protein